jgi:hypothetical protein
MVEENVGLLVVNSFMKFEITRSSVFVQLNRGSTFLGVD